MFPGFQVIGHGDNNLLEESAREGRKGEISSSGSSSVGLAVGGDKVEVGAGKP